MRYVSIVSIWYNFCQVRVFIVDLTIIRVSSLCTLRFFRWCINYVIFDSRIIHNVYNPSARNTYMCIIHFQDLFLELKLSFFRKFFTIKLLIFYNFTLKGNKAKSRREYIYQYKSHFEIYAAITSKGIK